LNCDDMASSVGSVTISSFLSCAMVRISRLVYDLRVQPAVRRLCKKKTNALSIEGNAFARLARRVCLL
jgi:hypothetical protein